MDNNVFINKNLISKHYTITERERRINDFENIYKILKNHLKPIQVARVNEDKIQKYAELYKDENKQFIKNVLKSVVHIPFDKFLNDSIEQVNEFNEKIGDKKYIFVIGVNNDVGSSDTNFNIYKSNLWMFMLMYEHLKNKPYDIILNLKIAIKLYDNKYDYLIMDDCMYSGTQIVDEVLYKSASETLFNHPDSFIVREDLFDRTLIKKVKKIVNVHLVVPYISSIANLKLVGLEVITSLNIIKYNKYVVNAFNAILKIDDLDKLYNLYQNFIQINTDDLIPIFFDHKISDLFSTIELILIKGQVLDDASKRLVFIDACEYNKNDNPYYENFNYNEKNFNYKKLYCPQPPYKFFKKILEANI
jgi:hypothetical protein